MFDNLWKILLRVENKIAINIDAATKLIKSESVLIFVFDMNTAHNWVNSNNCNVHVANPSK